MNTVKAINPKYQASMNKFIMWNTRYDEIVNETGDNGGRRQEKAYEKASEYFSRLPAREKNRLSKTIDITGY